MLIATAPDTTTPTRRLTALELTIICFGGFILSLIINYPGFMSYDSVQQLLEARVGIYSDWHPPFMAFTWHFSDKIIPGPFGMLIFETALIWSATFLISLFWFSNARAAIFTLAPSLLLFYPPIFGISGAVWKDICMWAFLIFAIGIAGTIKPIAPATRLRCIAKLGLGSLSLFAAILYRHNTLFAVVPLVALGVVRSIGAPYTPRRLAVPSAIGGLVFALMLFGATLVNNALTTYKTLPWRQVAIFDIAGVIHELADTDQQKAIYESIPAQVRGNGSLENLLMMYNPGGSWVDLVKPENPAFQPEPFTRQIIKLEESNLSEQDRKALMYLWLDTALHNPFAWLRHKTNVFRSVIGLTHQDYLLTRIFIEPNGFPDWVGVAYGQKSPELNHFQLSVKRLLTRVSTWHLFFGPWIYLAIGILLIVACLAFRTPERIQVGLIAASGVAHEAGLFLVAPGADFRYSHYMIYTSVLAFLLFLQTVPISRPAPQVNNAPPPVRYPG